MKKTNSTRVGSEAQYGPRPAGRILHPRTDLCCILKTLLRSDRTMQSGKDYVGVLRRDAESEDFRFDVHYTFTETLPWTQKRNPRVYEGRFITITRKDDGTLRPNFRPMNLSKDFNIDAYAFGVAYELREALEGLVEIDS